MLLVLQIAFVVLVTTALAAASAWLHFIGDEWWTAAGGSLLAFAAILAGIFFGDEQAWHRLLLRQLVAMFLSTELRALVSLVAIGLVAVLLCTGAYRARPINASYYEVRVYDGADLPGRRAVGAVVTIHTKTDGVTHEEVVANDGGATFRSLRTPTTLVYQVALLRFDPPFMIGGSARVTNLPDQLSLDVAAVPVGSRQPLDRARDATPLASLTSSEPPVESMLLNNAPWGTPEAELIIKRLGYVLGYDRSHRMARWVAYATGPAAKRVPRDQKWVLDPAIAPDQQISPSAYHAIGFDRGHLISPADLFFKGPVATAEAFYMSTVTPQTPWLNRRLWRDVEVGVRRAVEQTGRPAYVVAGPLFLDERIEEDVPIPSHFFRVMAMQSGAGEVKAFGVLVPNANDGDLDVNSYVVSIEELERRTALRFFPNLRPEIAADLKARHGTPW